MSVQSDLFRKKHFSILVETYDLGRGSMDFFVSSYFRKHPQLGSKDRVYLSERFFRYMRQKSLIDALSLSRKESILSLVEEPFSFLWEQGAKLPAHVRACCPQELYETLQMSLGDKTDEFCQVNMTEAPLFIRTNLIKTTREVLQKSLLEAGIESDVVFGSETALRLKRRANLFSLPIFREGWFELQDLGSQKIGELIQAAPKQKVFDFCAGSGGKTLTFAHQLQGTGQIFLHDVRKEALLEAKKRLNRAGVQNVQWMNAGETDKLKKMKGALDWVLVDAPCTGTGTLRRNPDMKWRWTKEMLDRLCQEQRSIFEKALFFLKPKGKIVYATCSVLNEENDAQVDYFMNRYGLEKTTSFQSLPTQGGMDGFFGAVLCVRNG